MQEKSHIRSATGDGTKFPLFRPRGLVCRASLATSWKPPEHALAGALLRRPSPSRYEQPWCSVSTARLDRSPRGLIVHRPAAAATVVRGSASAAARQSNRRVRIVAHAESAGRSVAARNGPQLPVCQARPLRMSIAKPRCQQRGRAIERRRPAVSRARVGSVPNEHHHRCFRCGLAASGDGGARGSDIRRAQGGH